MTKETNPINTANTEPIDESRQAITENALSLLGEAWIGEPDDQAVRLGDPGHGVYVAFDDPDSWSCFVEDGHPCAGVPEFMGEGRTAREAVEDSLGKMAKWAARLLEVDASLYPTEATAAPEDSIGFHDGDPTQDTFLRIVHFNTSPPAAEFASNPYTYPRKPTLFLDESLLRARIENKLKQGADVSEEEAALRALKAAEVGE